MQVELEAAKTKHAKEFDRFKTDLADTYERFDASGLGPEYYEGEMDRRIRDWGRKSVRPPVRDEAAESP